MKLGIITDIHEHVECLRAALDELAGQVDQIVMVGDVVQTGERAACRQRVSVWTEACRVQSYAIHGDSNLQ